MLIGIVKEIQDNENRVAVTPNIVEKLINLGYSVQIESNAGIKSNFTNQMYEPSGAKILPSSIDVWESSDIILQINSPKETLDNETGF